MSWVILVLALTSCHVLQLSSLPQLGPRPLVSVDGDSFIEDLIFSNLLPLHDGHHGPQHEEWHPFEFSYGVSDPHTHTQYSEHREADGDGNMVGRYSVALPDGRIQHVRYHAGGIGGTIMEVTYEGEAHHPDLVLPVAVDQPPPPAEPLSRSLPLPPRLARSHTLEDDEEIKDYELLLDLLDAMDPSPSWDTDLTKILDTMTLDHNPRFARSNDRYETRKPRFKRKRQLKRVDLDTSASTKTHSSMRTWGGASSFADTKMTPFVHHESVRPRTRHPRRVRGWRKPQRLTKYNPDDIYYRHQYY